MLEKSEIIKLMIARSQMGTILAKTLTAPLKLNDIYNLCKTIWDITEIIEILDENDELLQGYNSLQDWYLKASQLDAALVNAKLEEEYNAIFGVDVNKISINFPLVREINENYKKWGYELIEGLSPSHLAQMLFFISFVSSKTSSMVEMKDIGKSAGFQAVFIDNFIMPHVSDFCGELHGHAVSYGVYQHIAVILHGYLNLDSATMEYI